MTQKISGSGRQEREARKIDIYVGQQVRHRRMSAGSSQEELGAHLGITFQQVQKYENGVNRISAGRLLQIADFLGVRVESFFDGLTTHGRIKDDTGTAGRKRVMDFATTREGAKWNNAYLNAPNPRQRKLAMDVLSLPVRPER